MDLPDIIALRKRLGWTQAQMAERIGIGLRAWQIIEGDPSKLRTMHVHAVERAALAAAVEQGDPMLAPASVRKQALDLARMITGD